MNALRFAPLSDCSAAAWLQACFLSPLAAGAAAVAGMASPGTGLTSGFTAAVWTAGWAAAPELAAGCATGSAGTAADASSAQSRQAISRSCS